MGVNLEKLRFKNLLNKALVSLPIIFIIDLIKTITSMQHITLDKHYTNMSTP